MDTYTVEALQNCELTLKVSTKMNRSYLKTGNEAILMLYIARKDGDMIGVTEIFLSCENIMGVVQSSKGILKPRSEDLFSESEIV